VGDVHIGGAELTFRAKLTLSAISTAHTRKEIGPVSLAFEALVGAAMSASRAKRRP